ncbi:hypothetical protein ACU686_15065 [Yinghuangia aomiensis]
MAYGRHLDAPARSCRSRSWRPATVPYLRGELLDRAYAMTRAMAGAPVVPAPGQPLLDAILAAALGSAAATAR